MLVYWTAILNYMCMAKMASQALSSSETAYADSLDQLHLKKYMSFISSLDPYTVPIDLLVFDVDVFSEVTYQTLYVNYLVFGPYPFFMNGYEGL